MLFAARLTATAALRRGLGRQQAAALRQPARRMMGGGHSPAPHPSQPKQAFLFNEGPGPRKVEIWEPITSIVYWSTLFILVIGLSSAPETRIKVRVGKAAGAGGRGGGRVEQSEQAWDGDTALLNVCRRVVLWCDTACLYQPACAGLLSRSRFFSFTSSLHHTFTNTRTMNHRNGRPRKRRRGWQG